MKPELLFGLLASAAAQSFVPTPKPGKTVSSKVLGGAEISYKKTSICETTEGVQPYSGYLTIPSRHLEDAAGWSEEQSAHFFFWYFPARNDPEDAPTAIYLAGGPGYSSIDAMSDFPCFVNPDSNSTTLNPHSWNNKVNMLYIDQPIGTGFSYVDLANGTLDTLEGTFTVLEDGQDLPELNVTMRQATLNRANSLDESDEKAMATVPLTTSSAARTLWKFVQVWFQEFPEHNTDNDEISLWSSSYGGFYGPAMISYFAEQNKLIDADKHKMSTAKKLNLATLGLLEAGIDGKYMSRSYPEFAMNNTYGIEVYSEEVYKETMELLNDPKEGCLALIDACRAAAAEGDPQSFGTNETVNNICVVATDTCYGKVQNALVDNSYRNAFDITQFNLTAWPPYYRTAFFNQPWVQEDLGVPLNFTSSSSAITGAFFTKTGDPMIHTLADIEDSLEAGVNVAMVYGDRDGRCPWFGGEDASLALAFDGADSFQSAGYESIVTNSSYSGGFVRQHGSLSFLRIFQSGHGVGGYQPETMSKVFDRAMSRLDIATGAVDLTKKPDYATRGPSDVRNETNAVPKANENVCYVLDPTRMCTDEQLLALGDGSATVKNWVVAEPKGTNGGFSKSDGYDNDDASIGGDEGSSGNGQGEEESGPSAASQTGISMAIALVAVAVSSLVI